MTDIDAMEISTLGLSHRLRNCFAMHGCFTVGELLRLSDAQLFRIPQFGPKSLAEWKACLAKLEGGHSPLRDVIGQIELIAHNYPAYSDIMHTAVVHLAARARIEETEAGAE